MHPILLFLYILCATPFTLLWSYIKCVEMMKCYHLINIDVFVCKWINIIQSICLLMQLFEYSCIYQDNEEIWQGEIASTLYYLMVIMSLKSSVGILEIRKVRILDNHGDTILCCFYHHSMVYVKVFLVPHTWWCVPFSIKDISECVAWVGHNWRVHGMFELLYQFL